MMVPVRFNTIYLSDVFLRKEREPFPAPRPDIEDHATRLRDQWTGAGDGVLLDIGTDVCPEAGEPGVFEARGGGQNVVLGCAEEIGDGEGKVACGEV